MTNGSPPRMIADMRASAASALPRLESATRLRTRSCRFCRVSTRLPPVCACRPMVTAKKAYSGSPTRSYSFHSAPSSGCPIATSLTTRANSSREGLGASVRRCAAPRSTGCRRRRRGRSVPSHRDLLQQRLLKARALPAEDESRNKKRLDRRDQGGERPTKEFPAIKKPMTAAGGNREDQFPGDDDSTEYIQLKHRSALRALPRANTHFFFYCFTSFSYVFASRDPARAGEQ